ncbi:MAG TPA: WecB/TagA/CpsF family glycosyltransferase [Patescibacteria group bacterium]|nr:WecB/TagA/CpsF family glycosyltransferase [Patescibacteria group bacterium]
MSNQDDVRINILGIPIDRVGYIDVLDKIEYYIKKGGYHYIATVNPEFIMHAAQDSEFKKALQNSNLNTADGVGIVWASKYLAKTQKSNLKSQNLSITSRFIYKIKKIFWLKISLFSILFNRRWLYSEIPERVTGADLIWKIAKKAQDEGWKIFLLGAGEGVAGNVAGKLKSKFPKINIVGTYSGRPEEEGIADRVAGYEPDILFVAFGSPRQEKFIYNNLDKLNAKVVIGVGGTFDFIAGLARRAPRFMRRFGIEWLWRLVCQPFRIGRIINAFPKFVWKVWRGK